MSDIDGQMILDTDASDVAIEGRIMPDSGRPGSRCFRWWKSGQHWIELLCHKEGATFYTVSQKSSTLHLAPQVR